MTNSLRSKLSKLRYQGKITDEEYKELIDKLEGHDESLVEQIKWERDIAIEQLKMLGYGLGEKVKPCEDCVSRKELLSRIDAERRHLLDIGMDGAEHIIVHHARRIIEDMPSVKPQRPNRETEIWERIKAYIMSDDFMNDYPEDVTAEIWRMRKELEDLKND